MLKYAVRGIELILLLAGAITTLLILKGATIPYSLELVFSSLIGFWNSLRCFLSSPLYICIIINFIIVLIAFSSHFHQHETKNHDHDGITVNLDDLGIETFKSQPQPPAPSPLAQRQVIGDTPLPPLHATNTKILQHSLEKTNLSSPKPLLNNWDYTNDAKQLKKIPNTLYTSSKSNLSSQKPLLSNRDFTKNPHELKKTTNPFNNSSKSNLSSQKPLNSNLDLTKKVQELNNSTIQLNISSNSNLSSQKQIFSKMDFSQELNKTATQPESSKPKMGTETDSDKENDEEDTIEATWKLITGGGNQKPKKKELKKSETWTNNKNNVEVKQMESNMVKNKELRKSETFNDAVSIRRNGGLRRDPSVGLDELNNQVEAFIKKFNADMRLQRQESDQRFIEMVNQGV